MCAGTDSHGVLDRARDVLRDGYGIAHATLQVEPDTHRGCPFCFRWGGVHSPQRRRGGAEKDLGVDGVSAFSFAKRMRSHVLPPSLER